MASVNKVIIVGNLGRDVETRTFPSGDMIAQCSIATTDKWKDKETGEQKEATEWHRVVFNGRLAEIAGEYLRKGSQVYIEGALRTRKYTDKDGVEKYTTEIRADRMQMLGGPRDSQGDDGVGHDERQQRQPARGNGNGQRQQTQGRGNGGGQQRQQPARNSGGGSSGFDDFPDEEIPFRDPLARRGFHLVI